jgi:hypothetical protein
MSDERFLRVRLPISRCMRGLGRAFALVGVLVGAPITAGAVTYLIETPIAGDTIPVTFEILDAPGGNGVDLSVSIPSGEGELLGVFGNVVTPSLLGAMTLADPTDVVAQWQFQKDQVWKVGSGNTMTPVKKWDWGVRFERHQCGGGPLEYASFGLRAPGLDVEQIVDAINQGWVLGVRILSTNGGEGSSKMGLADGEPPVGTGPPTITIDQPPNGTITNQTPIAIVGTVTGENVTVTVNGIAAPVVTNQYSAQLPLSEGTNTITAVATNASGTASAQIAVVLDTTPPVVTLASPPDGALTTSTLVLVSGTVVDASPIASFTLNGVAVPLIAGAFSTTISIPAGETTALVATAIDAAGNQGDDVASITHGFAPSVAITAPADGTLTALSAIAVSARSRARRPSWSM